MADSHEPFDDPILGRVTWNPERESWEFGVAMPSGKTVSGIIDPEDDALLEREKGRAAIQKLVGWVVDHELTLRSRVAEALFPGWLEGWYDEEIDEVTTQEGFREAIQFDGLLIYDGHQATVFYSDGNLFGGHGIVTTIDSDGNFVHPPNIWG
jgi:hypothetical protein